MEKEPRVAFNTEELERLKSSSLLKDFVRKQEGAWNHVGWEGFLFSIRQLGYTIPAEVIGAELEVEKEFYWKVRRGDMGGIAIHEGNGKAHGTAGACGENAFSCDMPATAPAPRVGISEPKAPEMPKRREPLERIAEVGKAAQASCIAEIADVAKGSAPIAAIAAIADGPFNRLENAIMVEGHAAAKKEEEPHPWDNVDFGLLSREEKAAYMKVMLKKKMGEG